MEYTNLTKFGVNSAGSITSKNDEANTVAVSQHDTSELDLSYSHKTTFNAGKVVPIFQMEAFPGDVFDIDVNALIRMSIPSAPVMDSPRYDINFFFIPYKQVWEKFPYLIGDSYQGGAPVVVESVPVISYANGSGYVYGPNDLASHMELPQNIDFSETGQVISSLPFKAYCKVWDEWYRDENLQEPADFSNNNQPDADIDISQYWSNSSVLTTAQVGKGLLPAQRLRDYFASCLPFIQKGNIPYVSTLAPADIQKLFDYTTFNLNVTNSNNANNVAPFYLYNSNGGALETTGVDPLVISGGNPPNWIMTGSATNSGNPSSFTTNQQAFINLVAQNPGSSNVNYTGSGAGSFNITDLRNALVKQHQNELDARAGTRYYEKLLSYWGIEVNPLEIGRTELIGGFHDNININNVVQSAPATSTASASPLGSLGALSVTIGKNPNHINYSVSQYGIIIGLICVRTNITYSQGLPKLFSTLNNWDFYNPTFNGISEQPIYKRELYLDTNGTTNNNAIFGYNQPFANLKYKNNVASGYLSANATDTYFQLYTYQNVLGSSPTLSNDWIKYPATALENTLLLNSNNTSELVNDFMADFFFNCSVKREIPAYSVPGVDKI